MLKRGAPLFEPGCAVSVSKVSFPQSASGTTVPGSPATGAPSTCSPTTRVPAKSAFALAVVALAATLTVTFCTVISPAKSESPVTSDVAFALVAGDVVALALETVVAALAIEGSAGYEYAALGAEAAGGAATSAATSFASGVSTWTAVAAA